MTKIQFIRPEKVDLARSATFNERWVEDIIASDPSILGLGDLILKDRQRSQPRAGRLDLLLQDADSETRYEVEVQLGKTDESHVIRTVEYWDIERKRYPAYNHIAVIVAEDITSRFLNVINIFNGTIPLIAIQMNAYRDGDKYWLTFTKVLSEVQSEFDEEDVKEITDRSYWEKRGTPETVSLADKMLGLVTSFAPGYELKYNKFYIGLAKDGRPDNFAALRPRKGYLHVEIKLEQSKEVESALEKAGIDLIKYDPQWGRYHMRLEKDQIIKHGDLLLSLLRQAHGGRHDME